MLRIYNRINKNINYEIYTIANITTNNIDVNAIEIVKIKDETINYLLDASNAVVDNSFNIYTDSSLNISNILNLINTNVSNLIFTNTIVYVTQAVPTVITNSNIHSAVNDYVLNNAKANAIYGDIINWNTDNVTNMEDLFQNYENFNADISNWNVGNVTTMRDMFKNAHSFNQNISIWNVRAVQNMRGMFQNAYSFNQPINEWEKNSNTDGELRRVTSMRSMFNNANSFNQDITNWNVSNVVSLQAMFSGVNMVFNVDISNWNVSNVTSISYMFESAFNFKQKIYWTSFILLDLQSIHL